MDVVSKGTFSLVKKGKSRESKDQVAIKIIPKKKTTIHSDMENYSNFSQ